MFYKIQNWIDKELGAISKDPLFVYYFEGANLNEIEDSFYLCNKAAGIEMVLSNDLTISSIHLFSGKKGDFEVYKGELPFGLTFCLSQREIQTCLGKPKKSGGGHKALYLGYVNKWDKYYFDNYSLHLEYLDNESTINLITIASLKLEEYLNSLLQ